MGTLLQDLRFGLRMLAKSPGFTAVAVLVLGLGMGANTAIFSVIDSVLLKPLPYPEAGQVMALWEHASGSGVTEGLGLTSAEYVGFLEQSDSFVEIGAYHPAAVTLTNLGPAERLSIGHATPSAFRTLGVPAAVGRWFLEEEGLPGKNQVAVLSHATWQRRLGSDPQVVGRTLTLDGASVTIVGVMPDRFQLPEEMSAPQASELWLPEALDRSKLNWGSHYLACVARLRPRIDPQKAQVEVGAIFRRFVQEHPESYFEQAGFAIRAIPLHQDVVANVKPALMLLFAAVGFVLLISCANVANLLLAKASSRRKEMAVRAALGASRGRLVRQLLTEGLVLSVGGATVGAALAWWGLDLIVARSPGGIPGLIDSGLNLRVFVFTGVASCLAALLSGLAPAIRVTSLSLYRSMTQEGWGLRGGPARNRTNRWLVIAEVSMATVLVIGAGLLIRSFIALLHVDPGFDAQNLLTARTTLPQTRYADSRQVTAFFDDLLEKLRTLPGVVAAAAVNTAPLRGYGADTVFDVEGRPTAQEKPTGPAGHLAHLGYRAVSAGYFETMGIPLLAGRLLNESDRDGAALVTVVNETMARRFWPGEDPIGGRLRLYRSTEERGPWIRIVGVVASSKIQRLDEEPEQEIFLPIAQTESSGGWVPSSMTLVLRVSADPESLVNAVRSQVQLLDSELPIHDVQTMEEIRRGTVLRQRFAISLLGAFAILALVLAIAGVYGVTSHAALQRTQEIGIRMALGARPADILRLIVRQGMSPVAAGLALGLAGAVALTRLVSGFLFQVNPTDPLTFVTISILLSSVALLACWLPARRATRVDPMAALRCE